MRSWQQACYLVITPSSRETVDSMRSWQQVTPSPNPGGRPLSTTLALARTCETRALTPTPSPNPGQHACTRALTPACELQALGLTQPPLCVLDESGGGSLLASNPNPQP
eukprot:scaffold29461_cov28-Phaeocystis_antarctica.AAC.2